MENIVTKEEYRMGKAILAAIVTLIVGILGVVIGLEIFNGFTELGVILAVSVMGAFGIYYTNKNQ